jgi:hypothetical protein
MINYNINITAIHNTSSIDNLILCRHKGCKLYTIRLQIREYKSSNKFIQLLSTPLHTYDMDIMLTIPNDVNITGCTLDDVKGHVLIIKYSAHHTPVIKDDKVFLSFILQNSKIKQSAIIDTPYTPTSTLLVADDLGIDTTKIAGKFNLNHDWFSSVYLYLVHGTDKLCSVNESDISSVLESKYVVTTNNKILSTSNIPKEYLIARRRILAPLYLEYNVAGMLQSMYNSYKVKVYIDAKSIIDNWEIARHLITAILAGQSIGIMEDDKLKIVKYPDFNSTDISKYRITNHKRVN